jgi:2-polyprenyl-3-methyl-5-hydroxy-6-metoxy-1,4-benzoquinol methylase
MARTKERQYQALLDTKDKDGLASLGLMTNQVWKDDPRRLVFSLSRYKFVSKMLSGRKGVLEIGCADAFASRIVLQEVESLTAVDFDPIFIEDAKARNKNEKGLELRVHDILDSPVKGRFDAVYSLDVIEHIRKKDEETFMSNLARSLGKNGVAIIGTPSIESQKYGSPQSKEGHVNCKDSEGLRVLAEKYFNNVFIFSMNDEVVHTGFYPMAHYLFALCVGKK